MQVETHESDDLEAPGNGWVTLDRKLAAALTKISHGELGRMLTLHSNACLPQRRQGRPRQGASTISVQPLLVRQERRIDV